ncbi:hypothetical protein Bca52824_087471 [Brassica carinata]|uniref:Uncharacterized protein n=1 Tax=Brassica carinata TaxID=52824 RepID=A0A8X7PBQ1_BRACI|nr:hypothetical protein Bca52824_087471 [Brassica carinata]
MTDSYPRKRLNIDSKPEIICRLTQDSTRLSEHLVLVNSKRLPVSPEKYVSPDFKFMNPAKDPCWKRIIGNDSHITISELGDMLENDPLMPYERRLQLALIMIVDGTCHCGCVGAITSPRSLVKPRKEESCGEMNDFSGARKSKDMLMPWKKLDANEFGIQRSSISESTRMVANKLRKREVKRYWEKKKCRGA